MKIKMNILEKKIKNWKWKNLEFTVLLVIYQIT